MFQVLLEPLILGQSSSSLHLLAFKLSSEDLFFVALDASELAQPPSLKLALGVEAVRIVDVWNLSLLFLCSP